MKSVDFLLFIIESWEKLLSYCHHLQKSSHHLITLTNQPYWLDNEDEEHALHGCLTSIMSFYFWALRLMKGHIYNCQNCQKALENYNHLYSTWLWIQIVKYVFSKAIRNTVYLNFHVELVWLQVRQLQAFDTFPWLKSQMV